MITRSSIAFEDFLGSSIAPQVMPPCNLLVNCSVLYPSLCQSISELWWSTQRVNDRRKDHLACKSCLSSWFVLWVLHLCGSQVWEQKGHSKYLYLQISAFFLLSNFRKGRLPYIRPVGRLVGRLASPLIFFNIYRHSSLLLTQYHFTQAVPIYTDPVPPNTNQ